jgi:cell division protein FtsI/penicillin-binding protein 2
MVRQKKRKRQTSVKAKQTIPEKASWILSLIFLVLTLFFLKVWHLALVKHEEKVEESFRPQRRIVVEPAERGTIRDRFNIPLALNKVQYNAAVSYSQILDLPRVTWERDEQGKKVRVYKRKMYIESFVQFLAENLAIDPQLVEDLIYSRAAIFPNVPYVIKAGISEKEYYSLKMKERKWPGLVAQIVPRRHYPQGKVGASIVGYLGAISRDQYDAVAQEISELTTYLDEREKGEDPPLPEGIQNPWEVRSRLKSLREKSYTIQDDVGRSGVEKVFEEHLRGYFGKKEYLADAKGNFLRQLPGGHEPVSGQRVVLSISAELQEFAEKLLIQNEAIREGVSRELNRETGKTRQLKQPWIKGGAIIALEPNTGELLTMASYPRFDPNDFINTGNYEIDEAKDERIYQWLEIDRYIADLWDQKVPLSRENISDLEGKPLDENLYIDWSTYLNFILEKEHPVVQLLNSKVKNIGNAVLLQQCFETILSISGLEDSWTLINILYSEPQYEKYRGDRSDILEKEVLARLAESGSQVNELIDLLNHYLSDLATNYDKLLLIDLCRLAVRDDLFSTDLLPMVQDHELSKYRQVSVAFDTVRLFLKESCRKLFHELDFQAWREENQKAFLREKREKEKEEKRYARPYLDYLKRQERALFDEFWNTHQYSLMMVLLMGETGFSNLQNKEIQPYVDNFLSWHNELEQGAHLALPWRKSYSTLKDSIRSLGPVLAYEYLHTLRAFDDLNRPLLGSYRNVRVRGESGLEKDLAAAFYPYYGFSFSRSHAYRQATTLGSTFKLVTAYEALVQKYYQMRDEYIDIDDLNPLTIVDKVHRPKGRRSPLVVAYTLDGQAIPQLYKGGRILPTLRRNVGKVDLSKALETSSNSYFALLAGDVIENPEDLNRAAAMFSFGGRTGLDLPGEYAGRLPEDLEENRSGLYAYSCGQHTLVVTPLQTAVMLGALANGGEVLKPQLVRLVAGKEPIRSVEQVLKRNEFSYQETLALIGVDFPLFTGAEMNSQRHQITVFSPELKQQVALPSQVRTYLLRGMRQVVRGRHESVIRNYYDYPYMIRDYARMKKDIVGKSSTAEAVERMDLQYKHGTEMYNHCWFVCISFDPSTQYEGDKNEEYFGEFGKAELVVVVYLRFADYGKEAAPLATQVIKKWRELKEKYENENV